MNQPESILSLLPQAPPFIMVDHLVKANEESTITGFTVTAGNIFTEGGFFRESGLLENIAQTAAAGAGYKARVQQQPVLPGYIGSVKNFEIVELPKVGDSITTETKIVDQVFNVTVVKGIIRRGTKMLAQCEMKVFVGEAP